MCNQYFAVWRDPHSGQYYGTPQRDNIDSIKQFFAAVDTIKTIYEVDTRSGSIQQIELDRVEFMSINRSTGEIRTGDKSEFDFSPGHHYYQFANGQYRWLDKQEVRQLHDSQRISKEFSLSLSI